MKSRFAIIATLATGLLMSGTGATLAIDGLQATQDASVAQYGTSTPPAGTKGEVLGETNAGGQAGDVVPSTPSTPSVGAETGGDVRPNIVQPTRQVEVGAPTTATQQQLPFTGYAGITVLLFGLALLGSGLVLRSRTRQQ